MHSYYLDTPHDSRRAPEEVSASDQVRSRPTYSSGLGATDLLPRSSSFSSFWLFWKYSWRSHKGEVLSCVQQGFHPHRHQGVLKGDTLHASTSGWFARRLTTWIICISVGRSTILRTYVWRKQRTTSLVAPPIQWKSWLHRLIWKVDLKNWFEKLIQKSEGWLGKSGDWWLIQPQGAGLVMIWNYSDLVRSVTWLVTWLHDITIAFPLRRKLRQTLGVWDHGIGGEKTS